MRMHNHISKTIIDCGVSVYHVILTFLITSRRFEVLGPRGFISTNQRIIGR